MSDTELQGAHDHGEGPTEDEIDQDEPGRFRRFLAGVGRGLRVIFRPVVIATLAAVVAAGALVIVAVEQREQTDWQRRQACLAWYQLRAIDYAGLYAGDSPADGVSDEVFDTRGEIGQFLRAEAAEECGGGSRDDGTIDVPGADRTLDADDYDRLIRIYGE